MTLQNNLFKYTSQYNQQITKDKICKSIEYNNQLISQKEMSLIKEIFLLITLIAIGVSLQIAMTTADNQTVNMFTNNQYNVLFVQQSHDFNCSINKLYTLSQSLPQYQSNAAYTITFTNMTQPFAFTLQGVYRTGFGPSVSSNSCSNSSMSCTVTIQNNCPADIGQFNYFNILQLQVQNMPVPFSYYVLCNNQFSTNTFQWGLVILMVFCLGLIVLTVIYSKAWSMGGGGIKITYSLILVFWAIIFTGGILAETTTNVISPIMQVLILMIGVAGIWVCSNEIIFLLKFSILQKGLQIKDIIKIRVLDIISLLIGVGVALAYYFSDKNWIINDILCVSIMIASIKIMKYTNLKISIFSLVIGLAVQMTFVEYIHFVKGTSYNDLILNYYNYPFQLQLPTINPVYKQKCAWLPFTAIINPGIFMSYLRRFDISRNTNIYFISSISVFVLGSIVWMTISIGSVHSWPFEIVTGPTMMGLIVIFAYKRREIRTLWEGSFYDEDFANRDGLLEIMQVINEESSPKAQQGTQLIRNSVVNQLKLQKRDDSDMTVLKRISNFSYSPKNNQQQIHSKSSRKS